MLHNIWQLSSYDQYSFSSYRYMLLTWSSTHVSSAPCCGSGSLANIKLTVIGTPPRVDKSGCITQLQSCSPWRLCSGKPSLAMNPLEVTLVELVQRPWGFTCTTLEEQLWTPMYTWKYSLQNISIYMQSTTRFMLNWFIRMMSKSVEYWNLTRCFQLDN